MPKDTFPTEIEEMVQNISDVPEPNAVFLNSLREQFISKGIANAQKNTETKMLKTFRRGFPSPRLAWASGITLLIITLSLLATSPTVVNALKKMFGFIPGVGIVEQTTPLRVLAVPFFTEKDGVSINITQVVVDTEKTAIIYEYPAIEVDYSTFQPPATFKEDRPILLLPDGTRLDARGGRRISSSIPNTIGYLLEFPPLPNDVNEATLELTRLAGLPPGAGPEDWSISFHVIPAPEGTVLPLVIIDETETVSPFVMEAGTSTPQTPPTVDSSYGIESRLESFVHVDDGYLFIGSVQWDAQNYPAYAVDPMIDYATVTDAAGKSIEFEAIYGVEKPQNEEYRSYWAIKIADTNFQPPLQISITSMVVNFNAGSFQFDSGESPQPGQKFPLNADVLVAGKNVHFSEAQLHRSEFDNNLEFVFTAQTEPNFLSDLYVSLPINQCMGGGGGNIPTDASETIQVNVPICQADSPSGPLDVSVNGGVIRGMWQVEWNQPDFSSITPPAPTSAPVSHLEACVNMNKFKQALDAKTEPPAGLGGKVILYGPYEDNRSIWRSVLVNLDGSNPQLLGDGDGNFSPDGTKVAFSRRMDETAEQGIFIMDFATNQVSLLPGTSHLDFNPMWSPDGSQIVFNRGGVFDLYAINVDGSNIRRLTVDQGQEFAIGWLPDGQHLLYALSGKPYQYTNHIVDVQTGQIEYFSNEEFLGMSTDTKYKLTAEREPANLDAWTSYLSNLDGSNSWALAESDIVLQSPIWSNDDEWLLVSLSKLYDSKNTPVAIHLADCQLIPLTKLDGIVVDWLP